MFPTHVAFIMDGNGRWANERHLPRTSGHIQGAETARVIMRRVMELGIKHSTYYAFSTENWNRPKPEVDALMLAFETNIRQNMSSFKKNQCRIHFLGDKTPLPVSLRRVMLEAEEISKDYDKFHLNLAINYGSRAEIVRAVNTLISNGATSVSEKDISSSLFTAGQPDPDLIIRTAGEHRLSNFLLWQAAYSEFYSAPVYWPDFSANDLDIALNEYSKRTRKFGKIEEDKKGDQ